jgi:hypothetical protein
LVYYEAIEVSMAHGTGATCVAVLVWYWLKTYGSLRIYRWVTVGALVGASCCSRWQLATFAVLPVGETIVIGWRTREAIGRRLAVLGLAMVGATVAFLPQVIAWKCVYGYWLVTPVPHVPHHWLTPSLWEVLVSYDRGVLYWTPICGMASLGFFLSYGAPRSEPLALLFASFVAQVYSLSAVWGKGDYLTDVGNFAGAFLAQSYGMRHLTEAMVMLAPGLAALLSRPYLVPFRVLWVVGGILVLTNLLLVCQYVDGLLPEDAGASPGVLWECTVLYVQTDPLTCLVVAEFVALIGLVLLYGNVGPANLSDLGSTGDLVGQPSVCAALRWGGVLLLVAGVFGEWALAR